MINRPKLLMHIECLRGTGELTLASRIAQAAEEKGFDVTVVSGNPRNFFPEDHPHLHIHRLPTISYSEADGKYKADNGQNLEDAKDWKLHRTNELVGLYHELKPDMVLLSYWPFGNGKGVLDDEMNALLSDINASEKKPKVYGSIREVLYVDSLPTGGTKEKAAEVINQSFDGVLVHGDKACIALTDDGFDYTAAIPSDKLHYTGYVCKQQPAGDRAGKDTVLITAGGGDFRPSSAMVLEKALDALPLMKKNIKDKTIYVMAGKSFPASAYEALERHVAHVQSALEADNIHIRLQRTLPLDEFQSLLKKCSLMIGQAGIGTVMDVLSYRYPAVLIPIDEKNSAQGYNFAEQRVRAEIMAEKGAFMIMQQSELEKPRSEHQLVELAIASMNGKRAKHLNIQCNGAEHSADFLYAALEINNRYEPRKRLAAIAQR